MKKNILITIGDPEGIGPQIIQKTIREINPSNRIIILGDKKFAKYLKLPQISSINRAIKFDLVFLESQAKIQPLSFYQVKEGISLALSGKVNALVTGPISKEKWDQAGITYKGHTQLLADLSKVKEHAMFFWSENLKVALFTTHIGLKNIFKFITRDKLIAYIRFISRELNKLFKKDFDFFIPGLNPHAGEGGLMGDEEGNVIIPIINALKDEMSIQGPLAPDTVFLKALGNPNAVVIAFYHDQGLIPFKLLNFYNGVNMTLGLPFVRTSPDHGPAFDIAQKNIANPESMKQAILLADRILSGQS